MSLEEARSDIVALAGVDDEAYELMMMHLRLMIEANEHTNITGVTSLEEAMYLHAYDSLLGLAWLRKADEGSFADIGSGAGFPGIPLSLYSQRHGSLIEATKKKARILERFIQELGVTERLSVVAMRSEEVARQGNGVFTAVTARAVSSLRSLMELSCPLLKMNGILIAYKGPNGIKEAEVSQHAAEQLGMVVETCEEHLIPRMQARRTIIIARKVSEAQITLPRADGKAQRKPLG